MAKGARHLRGDRDVPTDERFGFAVAKTNPGLIGEVDKQLKTIKADGTYDRLYQDWLGMAPLSSGMSVP